MRRRARLPSKQEYSNWALHAGGLRFGAPGRAPVSARCAAARRPTAPSRPARTNEEQRDQGNPKGKGPSNGPSKEHRRLVGNPARRNASRTIWEGNPGSVAFVEKKSGPARPCLGPSRSPARGSPWDSRFCRGGPRHHRGPRNVRSAPPGLKGRWISPDVKQPSWSRPRPRPDSPPGAILENMGRRGLWPPGKASWAARVRTARHGPAVVARTSRNSPSPDIPEPRKPSPGLPGRKGQAVGVAECAKEREKKRPRWRTGHEPPPGPVDD